MTLAPETLFYQIAHTKKLRKNIKCMLINDIASEVSK
jgi:hypothetical protein